MKDESWDLYGYYNKHRVWGRTILVQFLAKDDDEAAAVLREMLTDASPEVQASARAYRWDTDEWREVARRAMIEYAERRKQ